MKRLAALLVLGLAACQTAPRAHLTPWPGTLASDAHDRHGWTSPRLAILGEGGEPLTYHRQRGVQEDI